jgi:hypothetical protein
MKDVVYIKQDTTGRVLKKIDKRLKDLPRLTRIGMRKWGNSLARSMIKSAKQAGIRPGVGNTLYKSIKWKQPQNSNYGELVMASHGVMLDRMVTHRLYFSRKFNSRLMWGLQARSEAIRRQSLSIRKGKLSEFHITVRKHPFIRTGYQSVRKNLRKDLKEYIVKRPV